MLTYDDSIESLILGMSERMDSGECPPGVECDNCPYLLKIEPTAVEEGYELCEIFGWETR